MNQITPTPKIEIIPSSAPFSEAQAALSGSTGERANVALACGSEMFDGGDEACLVLLRQAAKCVAKGGGELRGHVWLLPGSV